MDKPSIVKQRLEEIKEAKILPDYEELYFKIGSDLGFLNEYLAKDLRAIQQKRINLRKDNPDFSIAALDREFESTDEYRVQKTYKYWSDGLAKMMAGLRVKIESMRAEKKGDY